MEKQGKSKEDRRKDRGKTKERQRKTDQQLDKKKDEGEDIYKKFFFFFLQSPGSKACTLYSTMVRIPSLWKPNYCIFIYCKYVIALQRIKTTEILYRKSLITRVKCRDIRG